MRLVTILALAVVGFVGGLALAQTEVGGGRWDAQFRPWAKLVLTAATTGTAAVPKNSYVKVTCTGDARVGTGTKFSDAGIGTLLPDAGYSSVNCLLLDAGFGCDNVLSTLGEKHYVQLAKGADAVQVYSVGANTCDIFTAVK